MNVKTYYSNALRASTLPRFLFTIPFLALTCLQGNKQTDLNESCVAAPYVSASMPKIPVFDNSNEEFHEKIISKFNKLAENMPFFKLTLEAIKEKGYQFISYDKNDKNIPQGVYDLMEKENCGAVTARSKKMVYINQRNPKETFSLEGTLANEAVHIVLDPTSEPFEEDESTRPFNEEETKEELDLIKKSNDYTESEKAFHEALNQEILSQVIEDIVVKKLQDNEFEFHEEDLTSTPYSVKLMHMKSVFSISVLVRIYSIESISETDEDLILDRTNKYLKSGKVEKYLIDKLKEFGFIK